MAEKTKTADELAATKVLTSKVRLSYVHVWEPVSMAEGVGEKKYSVSVIISKDDKELVAQLNAAIKVATEQGKNGKWGGKVPANAKTPLRDGDKERPDDEPYKNAWFLSASTKQKPGIVDRQAQPITIESEVYSGIFARVSLNFYPFNSNGSKGVACGLNNIQKLSDGPALGGRANAAEEFGVAEGSDEEVDGLL